LRIFLVQIIKKIIWSKNNQNGGQNQDGYQAWNFHNSVNFYANQLKLGICKESLKNKIAWNRFLSKFQNGGLKPLFFSFGSHRVNRFYNVNRF
jgi:hypothetical protein